MSISPVMQPLISSYVPVAKAADDPEYERIKTMLRMLGIEPTGDKHTDKAVLQAAINQMQSKAASGSSTDDYIPFKDIMDSLNLTSTGKIEKDYDNTIRELDYRISMASDEEEQQYYKDLKAQVDTQYTENSYNTARSNQFMGASQLSNLNRYMLLS